MEQVIGIKKFGGLIEITDPSYDRDTWCRMNNVKIKPGEYECWVDVWSSEQTGGFGERVARIGIRLKGSDVRVFESIGEIGVDAGMAGFFENKKDYTNEEWLDLCRSINRDEMSHIRDDGFFSSSGYGDGCYPVYAAKNSDGDVVALEIHFITEEETEDD